MAEVGKSTGKKTQAGREVYETPDGKKVSEISTTFEYKGQWINVPTIHNGYVYDQEILKMMLDAEVIEPTSVHKSKTDAVKAARDRSESLKFDEGGDVADYRKRLVDMTDEERAEVAPGSSAYGNFLGSTGDKKPLSVQMAGAGLDLVTPVGTIKDIQDELGKKDPSYALIAGMAGLELLGPAAGAIKMAAKAGNKGVIQKILDSFKKKETDSAPGDLPAYDGAGNLDDVLTDKGVVDDVAALQAQKDSGMFNTEYDILSAWQAGVLDESEYFDETYKVLKNKLKYLEPPKTGKAPEWSDYGQAKKFVDVYDAVGKDKIIQFAKDYPEDVDLINKYHAQLGEYADELGIEPENLISVVQDSKSIVGNNPLTEVNLPKAVDTGDIYPRKATEYNKDPLAMPSAMTATDRAAHSLGFKDTVYHLAVNEDEFTNFKNLDERIPEIGNTPTDKFKGVSHDLLGIHVGTAKAAADRSGIKSRDPFNQDRPRFTMELRARLDKPVRPEALADMVGLDLKELTLTADELNFTEPDLGDIIKKKAEQMNPGENYISTIMKNKAAIALRKELAQDGYTHIPYENNVEDIESISYIMLTDRPEDSASVLRDSRAKFDPNQVTSTDLRLAQGGGVGNMSMKKQMSLFEYGGIADDGMNKDPVSGNNVPPGSLAKEVRDDIPAMLSEGEYVVPADVLRYYGVNFFENLRGQAKQGLNTMEQNGRIGGTPMTEQDVARNMQQPMMTPPPVQAAQGAMMQSPMRIQQQEPPKAMGNSAIPTQGYAGEDGSMVSKWSPARARYSSPMFQGTSSQQANIQTAQDQAATESITYMRTHYNQNGETVQIAYEGLSPESATPKAGQDQLLADYPLTEEEWIAYKGETSKNTGGDGGSGGGGDTTVSGGSDTSWMEGINFDDPASVKKWVESDDGLGMSGGARQLANQGVLGLVPQGIQANDIAKVRGIRGYYDSIGDNEMVKYLDGELKKAEGEGGILFSALDKLGLLTGDSYLKQISSSIPDLRKKFTDTRGDMEFEESGASVYKPGGIDVAMLDTSDDGPGLTAAEQSAVDQSRARASASRAAVQAAFDDGASTNTAEEIQDFKEKVEEAGGTWNVGGRAEGGLMTAPKLKKKKKSKPKKTGLAGKR